MLLLTFLLPAFLSQVHRHVSVLSKGCFLTACMNQRLYFLSRASGDSFKLEEQSRSWWAPYYQDPEIKNLSVELATYSSDALFFRFNCAKKSPFPQKAMPTFTFQTLPFLSLSMSCGVCLFAGFKSSSFFQPSSPKWEDLQKPFWSLWVPS